MDENIQRLILCFLTLQKKIDAMEKAQDTRYEELIRRVADAQLSSSTASASLDLNTVSDIARLKGLMAEGRESISRVTECVNGLIDIPGELAALRRAVRDVATRKSAVAASTMTAASSSYPTTSHAPQSMDVGRGASSATKRSRAFSPVGEPATKHHKGEDNEFLFDVYLWDVKTAFGSPIQIARLAMEAVELPISALRSALHPYGLPKSLISLRFNYEQDAHAFMNRLREKPPRGMEHLHTASSVAYGKRREAEQGPSNARKAGKGTKEDNKPW
jgi:hypothetical protein